MNRLEAWLLHISTLATSLTGVAYAVMRYVMQPDDPFSVLNHPWEPYMIKGHILAAPVLVFAVGAIIHVHVLAKLQNGARAARRNGLLLLGSFGVMVISGYLLQAVTDHVRTVMTVLHLGSGLLWFVFYVTHQVAAYRLRAAAARRNGVANGALASGTARPVHSPPFSFP